MVPNANSTALTNIYNIEGELVTEALETEVGVAQRSWEEGEITNGVCVSGPVISNSSSSDSSAPITTDLTETRNYIFGMTTNCKELFPFSIP